MQCRVIPLRADGRILKRSELPAPIEGRLVVSDWAPPWSRRWTRKAELLGKKWGMTEVDALKPILDVTLCKVDETGLYLLGHERSTDASGPCIEHVQVWWCQPHSEGAAEPAAPEV